MCNSVMFQWFSFPVLMLISSYGNALQIAFGNSVSTKSENMILLTVICDIMLVMKKL
jgi:hypothetical protein